MERVQNEGTVKLQGSYDDLQQSLNMMVQRAPNVTWLSIVVPFFQWTRLSFPYNLLGGDAPRLRKLDLRNCSLPRPLPIFGKLTSLHIKIHPAPTFPAPVYLGELLDFLDNTPEMFTLELSDAFKLTRMDAELVPSRRKVQLPCLDYLEAEGSGAECNYLLGSLVLPEACEVRLTAVADGQQSVSALTCAVDRLVQHCRARPQPFTHVDVVYRGENDGDVLRVGFSPAFFHPPNIWSHTQCRLTLESAPEQRAQVYRAVLLWLFQNLRGLQSIAFEQAVELPGQCGTTDMLNEEDFFRILCHPNLNGVHTVMMSFFPVAAFCASLRRPGVTLYTGEVVEGPMLRGLKTLVLGDSERCEWGELTSDEEDSDDEQGSNERRIWNPRVDGALADMVRRRKELQVPLERLVIKGYWRMEREFMDSLRAKVGNDVQIEETFLEHSGEGQCRHIFGDSNAPCLGN